MLVTAARTDISVEHAKAVGDVLTKSIKFCFSQQDCSLQRRATQCVEWKIVSSSGHQGWRFKA
jgi:hypothetical protein